MGRFEFRFFYGPRLFGVGSAPDLLEPLFWQIEAMNRSKTDPDPDAIRDRPRFNAVPAATEARLAQT